MANVTPNLRQISPSIRSAEWAAATSADTIVAYEAPYAMPAVSTVQIGGTFDGATVTFTGSNDGTTFFTLKDLAGDAISVTSAALVDFSTGARFLKPAVTGGTAESINVLLLVRG